jgi:hypothetical protein
VQAELRRLFFKRIRPESRFPNEGPLAPGKRDPSSGAKRQAFAFAPAQDDIGFRYARNQWSEYSMAN